MAVNGSGANDLKLFGTLGLDLTRLREDAASVKTIMTELNETAKATGNVFDQIKLGLGGVNQAVGTGPAKNINLMNQALANGSKEIKTLLKLYKQWDTTMTSVQKKSGKGLTFETSGAGAIVRARKAGEITPLEEAQQLGNLLVKQDRMTMTTRKQIADQMASSIGAAYRKEQSVIERSNKSIRSSNQQRTKDELSMSQQLSLAQQRKSKNLTNDSQYLNELQAITIQKGQETSYVAQKIENEKAAAMQRIYDAELADFKAHVAEMQAAQAQQNTPATPMANNGQAYNYQSQMKALAAASSVKAITLQQERDGLMQMLAMNKEFGVNKTAVIQRIGVVNTKIEQEARRQAALTADANTKKVNGLQRQYQLLNNYVFSAAIMAAVTQGTSFVVNSIKEIQKEEIDLQRVTSFSNAEMLKMRDAAFEISQLTAIQVTDIQKIQNLWARAGDYSTAAINELSKVTAIGMNVAGFENAEEAVSYLNAALKQFSLTADDAQKVMDSWVKVADRTAVKSTKDLAEAMMKSGANARILGMDYNDLNAIVAILATRMARSGEEIGTALKPIFTYLHDDSTIKILGKYGIQVQKNKTEYIDTITVLKELNAVWAQLKESNNQVAMNEIAQTLGKTRRQDFVVNTIEGMKDFDTFLKISEDSASFALTQNEKMTQSLSAQMTQLTSKLQALAMSMGEAGLLKTLQDFVKVGKGFTDWVNGLPPGVKAVILSFGELAAAMWLLKKGSQFFFGQESLKGALTNLLQWAGVMKKQLDTSIAMSKAKQAALQLEAQGQLKNTMAVAANTAADAIHQGTTVKSTIATVDEDAVIRKDTADINKNTAAVVANNATKSAATGATGLLSKAVTAMGGPIGIAIGAIGALVAGLQAYKYAAEQAAARQEQLTAQIADFNNLRISGVVEEGDSKVIEDRVKKSEELIKQRTAIQEQLIQKQKEFADAQKTYGNYGDPDNSQAMALSGLKSEVDGLTASYDGVQAAIKELWGTSEINDAFLKNTTDGYIAAQDAASLAANRVIGTALAAAEANKQTAAMAGSLEKADANATGFSDNVQKLNQGIVAMGTELGLESDAHRLAAKDILAQMDSTTQLTKSQIQAIFFSQQFTKEQKDSLIAQVEAKIASQDELIALNQQKIDSERQVAADTIVFNQAAIDSAQGQILSAQQLKDQLAGILVILNQVVPTTPTNFDEDGNAAETAEQKLQKLLKTYEEVYSLLPNLDHETAMLEARLGTLGDTAADNALKFGIYTQELDAYTQQQAEMHTVNEKLRDNLTKVNTLIDKNIKGWSSMTPLQRATAMNKLTADQRESLNDLLSSYQKITDEIDKYSEEWWNLSGDIQKVKDDMESVIEDNIQMTRENEKALADMRLKAQFEQESYALQIKMLSMEEEEFKTYYEKKIKAEEDILATMQKQAETQDYLNKLHEVDQQLTETKADTRFAYIDETTGSEIYTYDRAKVAELEKQRQDMINEQSQKDKEAAQQAIIDQLKAEQDEKQKAYDEAAKKLDEQQKNEQAAYDLYWEQRLSDESIQQQALALIQQQGYVNALAMTQQWITDTQTALDAANAPMMLAGSAMTSALTIGFDTMLQDWMGKKSEEMRTLAQQLQASFAAGLSSGGSISGGVNGWGNPLGNNGKSTGPNATNSTDVASVLEELDRALWVKENRAAEGLPTAQQDTYINELKKQLSKLTGMEIKHNGGFVGGVPLDPAHEVIAKLLRGELVVSLDQLNNAKNLLASGFQTGSSSPNIMRSGQGIIIHIGSVVANDLQQLLNSIQPYLTSRS